MEPKRIILEIGKQPEFYGSWTVGEVLQMAESLARWIQSLAVSAPPQTANKQDDTPPE